MVDKELKISISSDLKAQGFEAANKNIKDLHSNTETLSSSFKNLVGITAALGAVKLFKDTISETLDFADSLSKLSQKTGITADGLYSLSAAAKLSDVSYEDMSKSLSKFNKAIGETSMGTGDAKKAFDNLGISVKNQDGTLKDSFSLIEEISDKFVDMPDGASKATLAMQLFGKSGAAMIPLLDGGRESLTKYLGVMDADTGKAAEAFNDSLTTIGLSMNAVYLKTIKELAPTLSVLSDDFLGLADDSDELGGSLSSKLSSAMKGIITWGYGITSVFQTAGNALGNFAASASFAMELDWKNASYAWNRISTDFDKDIDKWAGKLNALDKADETFKKNSEARAKRHKSDYGLLDTEKSASDAKKLAAEYQKAFDSITDSINKNSLSEYDYGVSLINKKVEEYKKAGIAQNLIDEYVFDARMQLGIKQLEQETKDNETREKDLKARYDKENDAMLGYYKAIGNESDAFYLEEVVKLQKLADAGILSNQQMLEIWAKDNEKFQEEQFKKTHAWLYDIFDNVNKALDSQFFDVMTGKFNSFGDWLKNFFKSIGTSILQGLSRTLAGSFTNTLQGGIVNTFKSYGGFGGSSLVGSSLSASDMSSLISAGATVSGGKITTSGGTIIDQASGTVTSQGSDALSLLSTASSLKSVYGMLSDGISGSILNGFTGAANMLGNFGFTSAAGGLTEFGVGFANPMSLTYSSSATAGLYGSGIAANPSMLTSAGGMLSSGLIGYGMGSLGDAIFGAKTKAGIGGAVGAAVGSIIPGIGTIIGGLIGSVLGGFFGSTKQTGAGIDILGNATADSADGRYYTSYKKKSWFSSKSWTNYTGFSDAENEAIMQTIGIYDTLLSQLGEYNDLVVAGGRFSNLQEFLDTNVVKSFLTAINPQNLDEIYQSWVDYAEKIDSTITEALASAVSGFTTYKRGYQEWLLGSGTLEQLEFTANYLQSDFEALASSLGASSVTVDNFLSMYDEAIKNNFTQDTIEAWASLGDALMKSTDAATAYQDALDELTATTYSITPADMMLGKATDGTKVFQQIANDNATMKLMYAQMLKTMKDILTLQQFGATA